MCSKSLNTAEAETSVADADSPSDAAAPAGPVTQANIQAWADACNSHDIDLFMAQFTSDVVIHQPSHPEPLDRDGVRAFFSMIFMAYPDFHVAVTEAGIDGLKGTSFEQVTGTWRGDYVDPATSKTILGNGQTFDYTSIVVLTFRPDHKINQVDIYWDRLMVRRQLGLAPV